MGFKYTYPDDETLVVLFKDLGSTQRVAEVIGVPTGCLKSYLNHRPELKARTDALKVNHSKKHVYPSDDALLELVRKHRSVSAVARQINITQPVLRSYIRSRPLIAEKVQAIMKGDYYNKERQAVKARNLVREWGAKNKDRRAYSSSRRRMLIKEQGPISQATIDFIAMLRRDPCSYCGVHPDDTAEGRMTIDHIVPISHGGENDISNLTAACGTCNSRKGTKDLLSFLLEMRY